MQHTTVIQRMYRMGDAQRKVNKIVRIQNAKKATEPEDDSLRQGFWYDEAKDSDGVIPTSEDDTQHSGHFAQSMHGDMVRGELVVSRRLAALVLDRRTDGRPDQSAEVALPWQDGELTPFLHHKRLSPELRVPRRTPRVSCLASHVSRLMSRVSRLVIL